MIKKNNNNSTIQGLNSIQITSLTAVIALVSTPLWAGEQIDFDNGATMDWSVTTAYGIGVRTGKQNPSLMTNPNADDADRNFKRGSLTSDGVSALGEIILKKDNYGAVIRASTFYDDVYHQKNDNNSPSTVNKSGSNNEFTSDTRYYSGGRTHLLDAYVFDGWAFENGTKLDVKAGRHIESWGESLYYPGVSGVQNPADAVKAALPGAEVKDILLPVGQFSGSYRINDSVTLGAYVQYEWSGTELPPVGSYLSSSDVVGPGREFIYANGQKIAYQGTDDPRNSGQWGVQVRYRPVEDLELSLFHVNYHDKNPATAAIGYSPVAAGGQYYITPNGYRIKYFEDIQLTGISASTKLGETQISGEWSYRDGAPVMVNTGLGPTPAKGKGQQMQLSAIRLLGDRPWASQTTLTAEIVRVQVDSVQATSAASNLQGVNLLPSVASLVAPSSDYTYNNSSGIQTKSSSAYTVGASFSYPAVFPGWDLDVPLVFSDVFSGAAPMVGTISGVQGDRRVSVGTTFKYLGNLEVGLTYIGYLGSPDPIMTPFADRSYATASVKYTF